MATQIKPLTQHKAIKKGFNAIDCVRYFRPEWTDEQCDYHLWELTCFPFSTEIMIKQLNEYFLGIKETR